MLKLSDIRTIKYGMEYGWYKRFGHQYIRELNEIIVKDNIQDFEILQIKEKFGELRSYLFPYTESLEEFESKYEELSKGTCYNCGNDAEYMTTGWILPICDRCIESLNLNEKDYRKKRTNYGKG